MGDLLLLLKGQSQIQVIVPYMVVRELDGLKNFSGIVPVSDPSRSSNSRQLISDCARQSIALLYTSLQSGNSGIHGQTMAETMLKDSNGSPDDSILDCCLFWKEKHGSQASVLLLSNDKNLCVKAMVHSIKTVSNPKVPADKVTSRLKLHLVNGIPIEVAIKDFDSPSQAVATSTAQPHQHGDMDVDDDEVLHGTRFLSQIICQIHFQYRVSLPAC